MGSSNKTPKAPDPAVTYQSGLDVYLKNLPNMLAQEGQYRGTIDPQRIQEYLALQEKYGAQQSKDQLDRLHQLDPESYAVRTGLAKNVQAGLDSGYSLPKDYATEIENDVRGAQAARGNVLGNAAISQEALVKGKAANELYQQRLQNAGSFLSSPTPEQQLLSVSPVAPDRNAGYVNPNAGYQGQQFALNNYQNLLAQYQASGGNSNPWIGAAVGAASGYAQGGYGGAAAGAVSGYYGGGGQGYSDIRLKRDVEQITTSPSGVPIYRFKYNGYEGEYVGSMAHEVAKVFPEAVTEDENGLAMVDYDKTDSAFFRIR